MTRSDLLQLVEQAFPFVPRPPESEISFHEDECAHCEMSRKGLMKYPSTATELPPAAMKFVWDEWSTLSPKAAAWVLPSYLRYVLRIEDQARNQHLPPGTIEFFISSLTPFPGAEGDADEIRLRLSLLTPRQVAVLLAMLDYWKNHPVWSRFIGEESDAAFVFLSAMKE